MTDTSPADELQAAAEKIRVWVADEPTRPWAPGALAIFGPELADWLEAEAASPLAGEHSDRCGEEDCTINAALAVARAINGSQS
ncbi:hypothetical protein [Streptomyces xanthochromogenes]|uniref:hypothetical protein n=1 Tax=Streptomyces xanthochromogenes TaxID=67384 RepID=UPI0016755076|nr:hypothetical protein [Streptomyces xanthochromogenes]